MLKKDNPIRFHYLVKDFYFPNRNQLKQFLTEQITEEGKNIDAINYIFCDDDYLLTLNQGYLNHDTLTDIITFELSPAKTPLLADIYISFERVKENAKELNRSIYDELLTVIFHGALHLCGYKDKSKKDAALMRQKEMEYLELYRFTWNG